MLAPAKYQQEFAAAVAADKERRIELRSKFDELSTDELEHLVTVDLARLRCQARRHRRVRDR
jgi:hypothetical protein